AAALLVIAAGAAVGGSSLVRALRAAAVPSGADLRVESIPAGAQIFLDGRALAQASPTTIPVTDASAGRTPRLEPRLRGYRPWQGPAVVLKPGEHAFYRAQLEALATRLVVRTEPAGAEVALDGRTVGRTPLANLDVPADGAKHALRLRRHGFV